MQSNDEFASAPLRILMDTSVQIDEDKNSCALFVDALKFISNVKQVILNQCEENDKYNQFASALDDFYNRRTNAESSAAKVESLFENHPDLLSGFRIFLSKMDQETGRDSDPCGDSVNSGPESGPEKCEQFLCKVKNRFEDNLEVYKSFLEILIKYKEGKLCISKVYKKIYKRFFGHADLICEFESLLRDKGEKVRRDNENIASIVAEERLYEVDSLLSYLNSAKKIPGKVRMEDHDDENGNFSAIGLRCIEQLYGDYGPEVVELLRKNPEKVLPVVLPRLNQKEVELRGVKSSIFKFLQECHHLRSRFG